MYRIELDGTEIEATDRNITQSENQADVLEFKLLPNSSILDSMERFITKANVYLEEELVFEGYVVDIVSSMSSNGDFMYEVTCLSVLDYLNSIRTGKWELHPAGYKDEKEETTEKLDPFTIYQNVTVKTAIEMALNKYNADVTDDKKIYVGNINVTDGVYMQSNRNTILNFIQELATKKEAFIEIRKENNKNYLDFLETPSAGTNKIELGINMESVKQTSNLESVVTRIIPIGADGLNIKEVNGGKEYVQNDTLVAKYGVQEAVVEFSDVTVASNLKSKAIKELETINDATFSVDVGALDLSYIDGDFDRLKKSQLVNVVNPLLKLDKTYRIVELKIDLDQPWNTSITLSSKPCSAVSTTNTVLQALNNADTKVEVMDDRVSRTVSKGEFYTLFEQTTKEFNFVIGGDDTSVTIDKDGLTVRQGAIAIKNKNGDTVMWIDENGNLSVNALKVFGAGNNTVNFSGAGSKAINFKSDDAQDLFINFWRGTDTKTRMGVYKPDAGSDRSYQLFIEPGSTITDTEPMVVIRGANSTAEENELAILQTHGDIQATRNLIIGSTEANKMNVREEIEAIKSKLGM